ncbi:hypothetical protein [uncultured Ruthenibacterium sp.]|uniref:hypothetical protein n=1 Tax=uncultured Ruthenibacterium sp. TaxID=1905347 RepID=UPI00349ECF63
MQFESALTRREVLDRVRHGTRQMQRKGAAAGEVESRPVRDGFVLAWAPGAGKPRGLCLIASVEQAKTGCVIHAKFGLDPHTSRVLRYVAALVWVVVLAAALACPAPEKALCAAAGVLAIATVLVWLLLTRLPRLLCPAAQKKVLEFVEHNLLK